MDQPTDTVSVARKFSSPKLIMGYDITDGTPEPMRLRTTSRTLFTPENVTITYEAKRLATRGGPVEWAITYITVQGRRILASGKLGTTVRWTDSGWPCIDADDMDSYPRWLVQLVIANLPQMVPNRGHETMTLDSSWEESGDLSTSAQPFEV
jgi:hypothetical protein